MTARRLDAIPVVCHGPPAHRRQWYSELARLLAAAPSPAGALFEWSSGSPLVRTVVRPPELVELLRRGLVGASVRVEPGPGPAPAPPPEMSAECVGELVRAPTTRPPFVPDGTPPVDRVGVAAGVAPGTWLGVQTFWLPGPGGSLWLARRFRVATQAAKDLDRRFRGLGIALAAEWSLSVGVPTIARPSGLGARRDWRRGALRTVPSDVWFERPIALAARSLLSLEAVQSGSVELPVETPAIVLGASGSGKTTYLARWSAHVVLGGGSLFVIDLHGDLAPGILARLSGDARRRTVAIDATIPPVPGIAALVPDVSRDRAAAHLVAALKRLTPDGTDLYWGFRLERIFDTVVRLALESGGSLADVYDLLTSVDRRDAARLATRSVELARFLDELGPVVRRNPEFLWSAATRLSKVILVPALRELLAPEEGGLPVEELIVRGRSVLVRLPFATLGPEAAGFAATLVLGRVYLGLAAIAEQRKIVAPVSVVLDEVQAFSPRLVAELLTEGRKFGLRAVVATQYPERLARELANAARGALRGFVSFRVPRPSAGEVGAWLGLGPIASAELLPGLPTGEGLVLDPLSDRVRPTVPEERPMGPDPVAWREAVAATQAEFGGYSSSLEEDVGPEDATDQLLFAVLAGTESGSTVRREDAVAAAHTMPGGPRDSVLLAHRLSTLVRDGYLIETDGVLRLSPAGERRVGLVTSTGATRETAEHRALLVATFRRFAARGCRLEIVRQGRFDTTLPDARFRQLPGLETVPVPADLADQVDRARSGWAWRFFHGCDVHVEAEVSGALRPERVRHGVRKALARGAFILFVVSDAPRARRVRSVLRAMGLGIDQAQVWTIRLPAGSTERPRGTNR